VSRAQGKNPDGRREGLEAGERFDDYLGLASRSLAGVDLVSFHGRSGSGKSTAIEYLLARHPDMEGHRSGARVTVFDDLLGPREIGRIVRALGRGQRVLAACHFDRRWLGVLRLRWRVLAFDLDAMPAKIERWLDARGIDYTPRAVERFCRVYGANYADAAIILERFPGASFDRALSRFLRECRIE